MLLRAALAAILLLPALASAQTSPYSGQQVRDIKALTQADVDGLLQGKGMEMALPAELNGYPGPSHALELAKELGLTPDQIAALKPVKDRMTAEATAVGAEIVEKERTLDRMFADRTVDAGKLRSITSEIGVLRGRLRAIHLSAHLDTAAILSAEQARRYDTLRGYTEASGSGHQHPPASNAHGHKKP
ncbi:MAG TPA: periplasmic heavy metal sensor [Azospirillaceae bacterium]|nr:periplasmic heavy metal sensor [Azospirillaceae bacterium]